MSPLQQATLEAKIHFDARVKLAIEKDNFLTVNAALVEALRPFAQIAEHDIGSDEMRKGLAQ